MKLKIVIWLCLTLAVCYTALFIVEYKKDLVISERNQKLQALEEATDITHLKRTAKMYVDFLYSVHDAALSLWAISVVYGGANIVLLAYCAILCRSAKDQTVKANLKPTRQA